MIPCLIITPPTNTVGTRGYPYVYYIYTFMNIYIYIYSVITHRYTHTCTSLYISIYVYGPSPSREGGTTRGRPRLPSVVALSGRDGTGDSIPNRSCVQTAHMLGKFLNQ